MRIRNLRKNDFFLLNELDWTPLPKERDSIYLLLAVEQGNCSFVAEENGEFLGVILCTHGASGKSVYVNHFLVQEAARARGVGRKLLARLESYALKSGVRQIWLLCWDELISYYSARGYRENYAFLTPELKDYLRKQKKVHALVKKL